jgi:hypothetical protein
MHCHPHAASGAQLGLPILEGINETSSLLDTSVVPVSSEREPRREPAVKLGEYGGPDEPLAVFRIRSVFTKMRRNVSKESAGHQGNDHLRSVIAAIRGNTILNCLKTSSVSCLCCNALERLRFLSFCRIKQVSFLCYLQCMQYNGYQCIWQGA